MSDLSSFVRRLVLAVGWLACAALIAFGAAGIVAETSAAPGTPGRAELTWTADQAVEPGLAAAQSDMERLATEVEELGRFGRLALAALVDRNLEGLSVAIDDGSGLVAAIEGRRSDLAARLAALPGVGPGMEGRLGASVRTRLETFASGLDSTARLTERWATLSAGAAPATRLTTLLQDHDAAAAEAARLGSSGSYERALAQVTQATSALDEASRLRDVLGNTADVSTLDEWLSRNRALDVALGDLYAALRDSRGTVTKKVRDAAAAERAAQARLPPDTRGLVIIMAEVARGGLNQAVIGIEQARGELADAVRALDRAGPAGG